MVYVAAPEEDVITQLERLGDRFGLLIFDEAHHLPSEFYRVIAEFSLAPYRLGLTATPERSDGRDADLLDLIGPIVYRKRPEQLAGDVLKIAGWILCMALVATLRTRWFVVITLVWAACFVAGTRALVPQLGLHAATWAYLAAGVLQTALAAWALRGLLRRPRAASPAPAPAADGAPVAAQARAAAPGGLVP